MQNSSQNFMYKYFDNIEIGEQFLSHGRTITETDFVNWCCNTGDMYILHTNQDYAASTRFGQRIAPGILVYAYAAGLAVPADSPGIIANYGADRLRFTAPTFIGDTIRVKLEVIEKEDKSAKNGLVGIQWDVVNQNDVTVVSSVMRILIAKYSKKEGRL